jgi:hypothetical protein
MFGPWKFLDTQQKIVAGFVYFVFAIYVFAILFIAFSFGMIVAQMH